MRISDWSSDVCSSDLGGTVPTHRLVESAAVACEALRELRSDHLRRRRQHDHVLVVIGRHALGDGAAGIVERGRLETWIVGNGAMAAIAVEEVEFWEHALGAAPGVGEKDRKSTRLNSSH